MKLSRSWFTKILRSKYIYMAFSDGENEIKNIRFIFGNPFYKSKIKSDKKTELIRFKPIKNRKYKYPVFDYVFKEFKDGNLIKQNLVLNLIIYDQYLTEFKEMIKSGKVRQALFLNSKGRIIKKAPLYCDYMQTPDLLFPGDNIRTSYQFTWSIDSQYKMKDL